jgi:PASTA domain
VEDDGGRGQERRRPAAAQRNTPDAKEELVPIPDVRGLPLEEAMVELAQQGLVASMGEEEGSGFVLGIEPEAGSEVAPGTTVTLLPDPEEPAVDVDEDDPEEEDDPDGDEDDDGSGPPPHSEGKAKGKEKKDK